MKKFDGVPKAAYRFIKSGAAVIFLFVCFATAIAVKDQETSTSPENNPAGQSGGYRGDIDFSKALPMPLPSAAGPPPADKNGTHTRGDTSPVPKGSAAGSEGNGELKPVQVAPPAGLSGKK